MTIKSVAIYENGVHRLTKDGVYKDYGANDVAHHVYGYQNPPIGLMMPAIRWISRDRRTVLVERQPELRLMEYSNKKAAVVTQASTKMYMLPMPWTVYLIVFSTDLQRVNYVYMYARNSALASEDDPVYRMWLPNFTDPNKFCLGSTFADSYTTLRNTFMQNMGRFEMNDAITTVMTLIWSVGFNNDAPAQVLQIPSAIPEDVQSHANGQHEFLKFWEEQSLETVLGWTYRQSTHKISEMMSAFDNEKPEKYPDLFSYMQTKAAGGTH